MVIFPVLVLIGCEMLVEVKDGKITLTNLPEECESFSISLPVVENGVPRTEIIKGELRGKTVFGPVQLNPMYLNRTYEVHEITLELVCNGERKIFRNKVSIYIPITGEKEIRTGDFEEQ